MVILMLPILPFHIWMWILIGKLWLCMHCQDLIKMVLILLHIVKVFHLQECLEPIWFEIIMKYHLPSI